MKALRTHLAAVLCVASAATAAEPQLAAPETMPAPSAAQAAAPDQRAAIAQRIIAAQGITEQFEQQVVQQRESMQTQARRLFEHAMSSRGNANAKEREALERLIARSAEIFTAKELAGAWVTGYGKELSTAELGEILRYYESPLGRKDIAAQKAALGTFTQWMKAQLEMRSTVLLSAFASELRQARQ